MKNTFVLLFLLMSGQIVLAQAAGNIVNYSSGNSIYKGNPPARNNFEPVWQGSNRHQVIVRIEGLYNARADKQIAIFSLSQVGKSIEEVNRLIDERIEGIRAGLDSLEGDPEMFIDMISFVPMYEYEKEKKLFSKKTYNEIPKGFELKKNIHIGFRDGNLLNEIVAVCAENEVYDMVRVAYVSDHFEAIKDSLREKAYEAYTGILANYERIHQKDLDTMSKSVNEGFNVSYPVESYQSYQAFSRPNLDPGKAIVKDLQKPTTLHYVPAYFRHHEFVMHPEIIEPTIQLVYGLEVVISLAEKPAPKPVTVTKKQKELIIVTPQGELKQIPLD